MYIVAVTACPMGVAQTYMAAEILMRAFKERGVICTTADTAGSIGTGGIFSVAYDITVFQVISAGVDPVIRGADMMQVCAGTAGFVTAERFGPNMLTVIAGILAGRGCCNITVNKYDLAVLIFAVSIVGIAPAIVIAGVLFMGIGHQCTQGI